MNLLKKYLDNLFKYNHVYLKKKSSLLTTRLCFQELDALGYVRNKKENSQKINDLYLYINRKIYGK